MASVLQKGSVTDLRGRQSCVAAALRALQADLRRLQRQARSQKKKKERQETRIKDITFVLYIFTGPCASMALAFVSRQTRQERDSIVNQAMLEDRYLGTELEVLRDIMARKHTLG